jgi:hypothetical protein
MEASNEGGRTPSGLASSDEVAQAKVPKQQHQENCRELATERIHVVSFLDQFADRPEVAACDWPGLGRLFHGSLAGSYISCNDIYA